jgi:uncharacterized protein
MVPGTAAPTPRAAAGRPRRVGELLALFVAGPALLALAPGRVLIPAILAGSLLCLMLLLRDPTFDRRLLGRGQVTGRALARMLARTAVGWLLLLGLVALVKPEALFGFPRTRPGLWVLVMVAYPLLSALPQELIFRTFFFHRYARLIGGTRARLVVSAVLFGYAHIVLHNLPSVILSTVGGLLFAATYQRTRSTLVAALEHALYGCFVFSVGLGSLFYAGGRSASATFRL